MSEKLKFRVWDKIKKRYIEWTNADPFISCDGTIYCHERREDETGKFLPDELTNARECKNQIESEIFAGLTDKNGKDIYEGDIIRVNDHLWMSKFGNVDYDSNTEEYMKILEEYDDFQEHAFASVDNHVRELIYMINGTVVLSEGRFLIKETGLDLWTYWNESHRDFVNPDHKLEVIGNIHENPDLLGI